VEFLCKGWQKWENQAEPQQVQKDDEKDGNKVFIFH
jgi:hypothetical protein